MYEIMSRVSKFSVRMKIVGSSCFQNKKSFPRFCQTGPSTYFVREFAAFPEMEQSSPRERPALSRRGFEQQEVAESPVFRVFRRLGLWVGRLLQAERWRGRVVGAESRCGARRATRLCRRMEGQVVLAARAVVVGAML